MEIAAIMPCRGRVEQTEGNIIRLRKASNFPYKLICITSEPEIWKTLRTMGEYSPDEVICREGRVTYWDAMQAGLMSMPAQHATHIVNLANDLLPGYQWLRKGVEAYTRRFGSGPGLMGFNDGIHGPEHSSHFIIDRHMLEELGGWPIWYRHNYGDTELCRRTQEINRYGKAAWAVLYHNHPVTGANKDSVYTEGDNDYLHDRQIFESRSKSLWQMPSSSLWPR
jgi:hypothetical protein